MAADTYERHEERLLKVKPSVYPNGTCVDCSNGKEDPECDLADWIKGGTYIMKQCYDMANNPDYADACIITSHIIGEKINRCTHIHHSQEGLLKKQLMTRLICHRVGGCMQRCMGTDTMNALFSITYDCDQACSIEYHRRSLNYIEYYQKYDLICNYVQTDVEGSRNLKYKRAYMQPDPDSLVHVVGTDVDGVGADGKSCKGIVVRGAKVCNSNAPYVNEIIVNPTKLMGPDDADYAVAFALPGDWDGVKLMALPGLYHKRIHLEVPPAKIDDAESFTIFNGRFVPYDCVFMCGRNNEGVPCYAGYLALMFAHYHRHSYTGCKTTASEVIVSQAALVVDVNDITGESHVCERPRDIIQTVEPVLVAGETSAYHATRFPSGQWVPDEALTNAGCRLTGRNICHEYEILADLTGGVCASLSTEENFFAPETTELCNKYTRRGPAYSAEDTHCVMRMMENKFRDSYEVAQAVAEVHGGGFPLMETITIMSRYDLGELRKIAKYLAGIPGYGECPGYEQNAHITTPRAMLAKSGAMVATKKETK